MGKSEKSTMSKGAVMRQSNHRSKGRWARLLGAGAMGVTLVTTVVSTSASAASTPGVTSSSVTIGATVPLTGPAAPGYDEIAPAMNAIFAELVIPLHAATRE